MMKGIEPVLEQQRPDLVLVVRDVNQMFAGAVTVMKFRVPAAHAAAGLRTFDRAMPEEINRLVTDAAFPLERLRGRTECVAHFWKVSLSTRRSARKKDHRQVVFCGT